jgi:hypothetical protein
VQRPMRTDRPLGADSPKDQLVAMWEIPQFSNARGLLNESGPGEILKNNCGLLQDGSTSGVGTFRTCFPWPCMSVVEG